MEKEENITQSKTHSCFLCGKPGIILSYDKEKKILCPDHIIQYNKRKEKNDSKNDRARSLSDT